MKKREQERERARRRRAEQDEEERAGEGKQKAATAPSGSQSPESASTRRSDRVRHQQMRAVTPPATASVSIYLGPTTRVCEHCQVLRFPLQWEGELASSLRLPYTPQGAYG